MERSRLIRQLSSADEQVRFDAREELGLMMDDGIAREILALASSNGDADVRADALIAMGPVIEECGIDYDDELESDLEPELGPAVSRRGFQDIVETVERLYRDDSQPGIVRRRALEVLIRDPRPWHAEEVRRHFRSPDSGWRRTAVFAMGMIPGFDAHLLRLVHEESDPSLLFEAVRAAGEMEVPGVEERLRELAASRDSDLEVRIAAILALPRVDDECDEILETLCASKDPRIAEAAEEALDELSMFAGESFADEDSDGEAVLDEEEED